MIEVQRGDNERRLRWIVNSREEAWHKGRFTAAETAAATVMSKRAAKLEASSELMNALIALTNNEAVAEDPGKAAAVAATS